MVVTVFLSGIVTMIMFLLVSMMLLGGYYSV